MTKLVHTTLLALTGACATPELGARPVPTLTASVPRARLAPATSSAAAPRDGGDAALDAAVDRLVFTETADVDPGDEEAWLRAEIARAIDGFGEVDPEAIPEGLVRAVRGRLDWVVRAGGGREWLVRSLARMDAHSATVRRIFAERHLPPLLDHLALVESGYTTSARSHAGAVGMWQFMPATGRRYGLRVDRQVDERMDPVKATYAAREYLLDLLLEFGGGHDALLAIAAYNAGENRVRGVLRRLEDYRARSFWVLAERGLLPAETRGYVPMILAAHIAATNRARFGLAAPEPRGDPALRATPPPLRGTDPDSARALLEREPRVSAIAVVEPPPPPRPKARKPRPPQKLRYLVRRGNTPASIAAALGVPVQVVVNAAGDPRKLPAGQVIELPLSGWERTTHRVKKGDSLERIARQNSTSVQALRVFNGLETTRILAGDLLAIYRRRES